MPPHEPYPGQQPASPTPEAYDFIRQYGAKTTTAPLTNMPPVTRIVIAVIGIVILLALIFGFIQLLSKPSNPTQTSLISIAAQENEIARVAKEASQTATGQPTLNFAVTMEYSMSSDQANLLALLKANGVQPSPQLLASLQSSTTDAQLTGAQTNGTYDQTYTTIAQAQLSAYIQKLKQTFATATSAKEKQWIQGAYQHAQLLQKMSTQTE